MSMSNPTPGCCGYTCISGFNNSVDGEIQDVGNTLNAIQGGLTGKARRFVLAILNANQQTTYGPVLTGHGFVLLTVFDNSSGSRCYVYGYVTGNGFAKVNKGLMKENGPKRYGPAKGKKDAIPNPFADIANRNRGGRIKFVEIEPEPDLLSKVSPVEAEELK